MKNKLAVIIGVATLMLATVVGKASTNAVPDLMPPISPTLDSALQGFADVVFNPTNFAVVVGGGRSMKGNNNLAFADYLYSLNNNAALVLGYDYLWTSTAGVKSSANAVKGGLNLKAKIYPFKALGATNFFLTAFGSELVSTPINGTANNGGLANIALTGISYETPQFWGLNAEFSVFYENRTGTGSYSGNYGCAAISISKGF